MDMNNSWEISISWETTSSNEEWRGQMDNGVEAPYVSGDDIQLPQGGTRKSKAAVTGGVFESGSEAATYAEENGNKIISSILPVEFEDRISDFLNGTADINDLEFLLTNIMKNEYMKIASEFKDNEDEAIATEMVINSLAVKITINGMPTEEEIVETAESQIVEMIQQCFRSDAL